MKKLILLIILMITINYYAQDSIQTVFTYDNYEQEIIMFKPKQRNNVSKEEFDYGLMVINETKRRVKNNPENFKVFDYFNILLAFLTLSESKENIDIAFEKFKDAEGSCEYFISMDDFVQQYSYYDIIREDYNKQLEICKSKQVVEKEFNIIEYTQNNNLDLRLIETINNVNIGDQKYRINKLKEITTKQKMINQQNQDTIDSLYAIYKTYIGKKLVGKKFEGVMWSVIMHSNPEMMERYLPIIQEAVENGDLNIGHLKLLIDRYYGLKYGYQIFGTQRSFGYYMADDNTRVKIKKKYGIE